MIRKFREWTPSEDDRKHHIASSLLRDWSTVSRELGQALLRRGVWHISGEPKKDVRKKDQFKHDLFWQGFVEISQTSLTHVKWNTIKDPVSEVVMPIIERKAKEIADKILAKK